MSTSIQGKRLPYSFDGELPLTYFSAFWGQSFVTELTRISTQSAEKFQSKRASLAGAYHEQVNGVGATEGTS
jgi:hypothetical protein